MSLNILQTESSCQFISWPRWIPVVVLWIRVSSKARLVDALLLKLWSWNLAGLKLMSNSLAYSRQMPYICSRHRWFVGQVKIICITKCTTVDMTNSTTIPRLLQLAQELIYINSKYNEKEEIASTPPCLTPFNAGMHVQMVKGSFSCTIMPVHTLSGYVRLIWISNVLKFWTGYQDLPILVQ